MASRDVGPGLDEPEISNEYPVTKGLKGVICLSDGWGCFHIGISCSSLHYNSRTNCALTFTTRVALRDARTKVYEELQ